MFGFNTEFYLFVILALALAAWWDNIRCQEIAKRAGKYTCDRENVQFLDDTVQLKKIRIARSPSGKLHLCRVYLFEYSLDGNQRCQGKIKLCGKVVNEVSLENYSIYVH